MTHHPTRATLRIASAVAHHLHLDPASIFSRDKHKTAVLGRQIVAYVLREHQHPQPSLCEIARELDRDHTTLIAGLRSIVRKAVVDEYIRDAIEVGRIALQSLDLNREVRRLALSAERDRLVRRASMLNDELAALRLEGTKIDEALAQRAASAAE